MEVQLVSSLRLKTPDKEGEYKFVYNISNPSENEVILQFDNGKDIQFILKDDSENIVSETIRDAEENAQGGEIKIIDNYPFATMIFNGLDPGKYTLEAKFLATNLEKDYFQQLTFEVEE